MNARQDRPAENPYAATYVPDEESQLPKMSPLARAAGCLGVLSVFIIFAPFAILTGIYVLKDIRENPQRKGTGRAIFGIVMGTIFTLLGAMIFLG